MRVLFRSSVKRIVYDTHLGVALGIETKKHRARVQGDKVERIRCSERGGENRKFLFVPHGVALREFCNYLAASEKKNERKKTTPL